MTDDNPLNKFKVTFQRLADEFASVTESAKRS